MVEKGNGGEPDEKSESPSEPRAGVEGVESASHTRPTFLKSTAARRSEGGEAVTRPGASAPPNCSEACERDPRQGE